MRLCLPSQIDGAAVSSCWSWIVCHCCAPGDSSLLFALCELHVFSMTQNSGNWQLPPLTQLLSSPSRAAAFGNETVALSALISRGVRLSVEHLGGRGRWESWLLDLRRVERQGSEFWDFLVALARAVASSVLANLATEIVALALRESEIQRESPDAAVVTAVVSSLLAVAQHVPEMSAGGVNVRTCPRMASRVV